MVRTTEFVLAISETAPRDGSHPVPNALSTLVAIALLLALYAGSGLLLRLIRALSRHAD